MFTLYSMYHMSRSSGVSVNVSVYLVESRSHCYVQMSCHVTLGINADRKYNDRLSNGRCYTGNSAQGEEVEVPDEMWPWVDIEHGGLGVNVVHIMDMYDGPFGR